MRERLKHPAQFDQSQYVYRIHNAQTTGNAYTDRYVQPDHGTGGFWSVKLVFGSLATFLTSELFSQNTQHMSCFFIYYNVLLVYIYSSYITPTPLKMCEYDPQYESHFISRTFNL